MLRPLTVVAVAALLFGACSDDSNGTPDGATTADRGATDMSPDRGSGLDAKRADLAPADSANANPDQHAPTPDQSAPTPDQSAPTPDRRVPTPDGPGAPGCSGVQCVLVNDCCDCTAYDQAGPAPPPCNIKCKQSICSMIGLTQPQSYCESGRCLITGGPGTCKTDSDCAKINTCCDCLALPKGAAAPPCKITSCFVPHCTAIGLSKHTPRCVKGQCRMSL